MPRKLPFRVIHASGQDDSYRASELNYHSPLTKGWQASRYKYIILHQSFSVMVWFGLGLWCLMPLSTIF